MSPVIKLVVQLTILWFKQVPATRILITGARGSGKSTQARILAETLDLFHIKFRDYLQELVIGKTKKFLEPEREEDREKFELELSAEISIIKIQTFHGFQKMNHISYSIIKLSAETIQFILLT